MQPDSNAGCTTLVRYLGLSVYLEGEPKFAADYKPLVEVAQIAAMSNLIDQRLNRDSGGGYHTKVDHCFHNRGLAKMGELRHTRREFST
jgi:hypothetical protein